MDKNNIIDLLKSHGQKITPTRLWIIDQLGQAKKPLNPYELLDLDPEATIDITTIYRNLELFETLGIIHKIQSLGGYSLCHHNHENCHHHDIVICNDCHTIAEVHLDTNTKQLLGLSQGPVELNGRCESCEQKN